MVWLTYRTGQKKLRRFANPISCRTMKTSQILKIRARYLGGKLMLSEFVGYVKFNDITYNFPILIANLHEFLKSLYE